MMARALVVLASIGTIFFLEWAGSVLIPLVFALFLVAAFWPIHRFLTKYVPSWLSAVGCGLLFVGFVFGLGWALSLTGEYVAERSEMSDYRDKVDEVRSKVVEAGRKVGMTESDFEGNSLRDVFSKIFEPVQAFLVGGTLTVAFLVLGLLEVRDYGRKVKGSAPDRYPRMTRVLDRVAINFQRYIVVRTAIGLLTGLLVTLAAFVIGLDLAPVWGLINFLLNYVPTLGSILGVVPPTLFALIQYDDLQMVLLVFGVVGGVQLLMGNYIDPLVQGRYLSLSPVIILFAVTFWGFIWGIAGALLAVPLTLFLALMMREFPSSRFLGSLLLASENRERGAEESNR